MQPPPAPALARRASQLSPTLPAAAPAGSIAFDSGHAFPGVLPDLTTEAARALAYFRHETLQYAPRAGLPELRSWIAEYMTSDGAITTSSRSSRRPSAASSSRQ